MRLALSTWGGVSEALPSGISELIPAAKASLEARMTPATTDEKAGLFQRLWNAVASQPEPETQAEWFRLLEGYPAKILAEAIDEVARNHRWNNPPRIGDVTAAAKPMMERLHAWKRKLENAEFRLSLEAKEAALTAKVKSEAIRRFRENNAKRDNLPQEKSFNSSATYPQKPSETLSGGLPDKSVGHAITERDGREAAQRESGNMSRHEVEAYWLQKMGENDACRKNG